MRRHDGAAVSLREGYREGEGPGERDNGMLTESRGPRLSGKFATRSGAHAGRWLLTNSGCARHDPGGSRIPRRHHPGRSVGSRVCLVYGAGSAALGCRRPAPPAPTEIVRHHRALHSLASTFLLAAVIERQVDGAGFKENSPAARIARAAGAGFGDGPVAHEFESRTYLERIGPSTGSIKESCHHSAHAECR